MLARIRSFRLPKAGNTVEEYEDACWPTADGTAVDLRGSPLRVAVADGATETSFSRLWAELLVEAYGTYRLNPDDRLADLGDLRRQWREQVEERIKDKSWAVVEKARQGAFAALAGLTVYQTPSGEVYWHAAAAGDSCVILCAEGRLLRCFPLARSEEFDNRPALLSSSRAGAPEPGRDVTRSDSGILRAPCTFYLLTDALACWFLRFHEDARDPASILDALGDSQQFEQFVQAQRQAAGAWGGPALKNDDVTLLRVEIPKPEGGDGLAVEQ